MSAPKAPDVLGFLDFREYLRSYYEFHKQNTPGFSHRTISQEAQLGSRSHFFDVMYGRTLTGKFVPRYVHLLGLEGDRARYFQALVRYGQARSDVEKGKAFQTLAQLSPELATLKLDQQYMRLFSRWYQPVLLALLSLYPHEQDPEVLARLLRPRVTALQAKESLELLMALGLVEWKRGTWKISRRFLSCSAPNRELALKPFHRAMQQFGIYHYDNHYEDQEFSTLTLATTRENRKAIGVILSEARRRILDLVKETPGEELLLQLNLQTFVLTESKPRRRRT